MAMIPYASVMPLIDILYITVIDDAKNRPSQEDNKEALPTERADETDAIAALTNESPNQDGANYDKDAEDPKGGNDKRNTLPDDAEERAKYLTEFHARPM
jgi:hypothetical protein